jgi:hypothetical protein
MVSVASYVSIFGGGSQSINRETTNTIGQREYRKYRISSITITNGKEQMEQLNFTRLGTGGLQSK